MNLLNALIGLLNDFGRAIFRRRSTDNLVDETTDSMRKSWGNSYSEAKSAGGQIEITEGLLAEAKSSAGVAHANLSRATKASAKLTGEALKRKQKEILRLKELAVRADEVVEAMETGVATARELQEVTEGGVADFAMEIKLKEAENRNNAAMEKLYGIMENVYDSQLSAAGALKNARYTDHSREISDRMRKQKGETQAAERMARQVLGRSKTEEDLTDEELALLDEVYAEEGVTRPETAETTETSATS